MSFQWNFLATFLYCELFIVIILLLPFFSPITWQKFFKSRIARTFQAGSKYYFNFIICIFALLFMDSIRELRKYAGFNVPDLSTPHAEAHAHMKQFRSQRNFYIAGFALFLWFVIKRLINLLGEAAHEMANATAARKQAEGVHRHLEGLMSNEPKKSDSQEAVAGIEKYKQEAMKIKEDADTLREQYEHSIAEYNKLQEEHRRLQIKLAISSGDESSKTR